MRVESNQMNDHGGVAIINFSTQTNTILMPDRKMYMELPAASRGQPHSA